VECSFAPVPSPKEERMTKKGKVIKREKEISTETSDLEKRKGGGKKKRRERIKSKRNLKACNHAVENPPLNTIYIYKKKKNTK